jgi:hypothetical protein
VKFFVISTGHKPTEEHFSQHTNSIDFNTAYQHIVMIDGAEDDKKDMALCSGFRFVYYQKGRNYALRNTVMAITLHEESMADDDVICVVDLDDRLLPGALETVKATYDASPKVLLTYGSYVNASGRPARFNGAYKRGENVRRAPWRASHLRTFKYRLWKQLPMSACLDADGEWFQMCADLAVMIPLMEIAGLDRCQHISKPIYWYNDLNPENDHKVNGAQQKETERYIRSQKPFPRFEKI